MCLWCVFLCILLCSSGGSLCSSWPCMDFTSSSWSRFTSAFNIALQDKHCWMWREVLANSFPMVAGSTPRFWCLWRVSSGAWSRVVLGQRITGLTRWERMPPLATPLWFFSTKVRTEVKWPRCSDSIRWRKFMMMFTGQEPPPVVMVDELLILNPHKLSFSEASMRIMITPHFSPRTRLSMAGRMVISEVLNAV